MEVSRWLPARTLTTLLPLTPQTLALGVITTAWTTNNIAVHPYLNRAYVTGSNSATLLVIDTTTLSLAPPINLSGELEDVAVSADGRYLFVSHRYDTKMTVIDALDQSVYAVASGPEQLRGLEAAPKRGGQFTAQRTTMACM